MVIQLIEDNMVLIIFIIILLWIFIKNHKDDICSLFRGHRNTFIISTPLKASARGKTL